MPSFTLGRRTRGGKSAVFCSAPEERSPRPKRTSASAASVEALRDAQRRTSGIPDRETRRASAVEPSASFAATRSGWWTGSAPIVPTSVSG